MQTTSFNTAFGVSNQVFNYNGAAITFAKGDTLMVNATEMAKPFGKTPKDWLRTAQAQDFINTVASDRHICPSLLVTVRKGNYSDGGEQGTWFHEDVALAFAQWLSPKFYLWCNDRIKELLTQGTTSIANFPVPRTFSEALRLAADQAEKLEIAQARLAEALPKADYCDEILLSHDSVVVSQIAKDYGMSAKKFNLMLAEFGVQFKLRGQWLLNQTYAGQGYHESKTTPFIHKDGTNGSSILTVWTQKGRLFLYHFLKDRGVLPLIEQQPQPQFKNS